MKKLLITIGSSLLVVAVTLGIIGAQMNRYSYANLPANLGASTDIQKITGRVLTEQYALQKVFDEQHHYFDVITVYGSSELRTTDIPTHPSNFFQGENVQAFKVNLVGRGSCQSLIHALSIAACGDALSGRKVVLITSPQSFVEGGIAPDMFKANFSEQQYLALMGDESIPDEMKQRFSARVDELLDEYAAATDTKRENTAASMLASATVDGNDLMRAAIAPYTAASEWLLDTKDSASAKRLISESREEQPFISFDGWNGQSPESIDWDAETEKAVAEAEAATDNNEFGILNDYYTTYIGRKLAQQKDKDADLSYSVSKEYDDLRLLLDVCRLKGIEPLFVHVPLHGDWSDYTGFTAERRAEYYENVREIVEEYDNVTLLDLTGYEYEEYFLCDIMHLGWKGWLEVDKALVEYYNAD